MGKQIVQGESKTGIRALILSGKKNKFNKGYRKYLKEERDESPLNYLNAKDAKMRAYGYRNYRKHFLRAKINRGERRTLAFFGTALGLISLSLLDASIPMAIGGSVSALGTQPSAISTRLISGELEKNKKEIEKINKSL